MITEFSMLCDYPESSCPSCLRPSSRRSAKIFFFCFLLLLPDRQDTHPLGCHNPRIEDAVVFDRLVLALVSGMGYERFADEACSATTIRRGRGEWIEAGVAGHLVLAVLRTYDRMVGLELEALSADGCTTKAPSGGECAGKSPVDRASRAPQNGPSSPTATAYQWSPSRPGRTPATALCCPNP
jgi:hypothetical protein